jgi:hypothetical protein
MPRQRSLCSQPRQFDVTAAYTPAAGVITLKVATAVTAASVSVTFTGTLGAATGGTSDGIKVRTIRGASPSIQVKDRESAGFATGALGGQVTSVAVEFPTGADRAPGATGKTATVSFKLATALVTSEKVSIAFPANYLTATVATTDVANLRGFAQMSTTLITLSASGSVDAGAVHKVTLTGVTIPGPANAGSAYFGPATALCNGIWVETPVDLRSVEKVGTIGFGGQVSAVSLSVTAADAVPAATGKSVTVGFTIQTALAAANAHTCGMTCWCEMIELLHALDGKIVDVCQCVVDVCQCGGVHWHTLQLQQYQVTVTVAATAKCLYNQTFHQSF